MQEQAAGAGGKSLHLTFLSSFCRTVLFRCPIDLSKLRFSAISSVVQRGLFEMTNEKCQMDPFPSCSGLLALAACSCILVFLICEICRYPSLLSLEPFPSNILYARRI